MKRKNKRADCRGPCLAGGKRHSDERRRLFPDQGFTLIELMVAASILGMIGLAILTTFGSGFSVYERVQAFGGVQADALLALEEMERDIRNIFPFPSVAVEGEKDRFAFPAVVDTVSEEGGEAVTRPSVGKVAYFLDSDGKEEKVLKKSRTDYPGAVSKNVSDAHDGETLVAVSGLAFRYLAYDLEDETYVWSGSWGRGKGSTLRGVEVTLTYPAAGREVELVRTVFLPVAGIMDSGVEEDADEGGEDIAI